MFWVNFVLDTPYIINRNKIRFVIRNLYLQGLQPGAKVTVTSLLLLTGNSSTTVEYIDFKIDHALHRASGGFRTRYCGVFIASSPTRFMPSLLFGDFNQHISSTHNRVSFPTTKKRTQIDHVIDFRRETDSEAMLIPCFHSHHHLIFFDV